MNAEIYTIIGTGLAIVSLIYSIIRNFRKDLAERFDKIDDRFDKIDNRFDKLNDDLKELRTGLNRMEGAFYSKDCCMLKHDHKIDKAE
jgi:hypothetical protein